MAESIATLAYLAGMIDADGFISVNRSTRKGVAYYGPVIGISGTRRQPHDLAAGIWGGNVSEYFPHNKNHRSQFQWSRMGKHAMPMIEAVYPYLLIKREQAEVAMQIWEHLELSREDDPFPWYGPHYDFKEKCENLYREMVSLNQSRNRLRANSHLVPKLE